MDSGLQEDGIPGDEQSMIYLFCITFFHTNKYISTSKCYFMYTASIGHFGGEMQLIVLLGFKNVKYDSRSFHL